MPYGVVAPGIHDVYTRKEDVDRVLYLYPYAKCRYFRSEEQCWDFVRKNINKRRLTKLTRYGDTFKTLYVTMEYFISDDFVCYNFYTKNFGTIKIVSNEALVENRTDIIKAMIPDTRLSNNTINGHLIAIYHGVKLLGDFVDVEIKVPDHSIFYTLQSYSGNNKTINRVLRFLKDRAGKYSVTLTWDAEDEEELEVDDYD